ncbi:uncharacterized protein LOC131943094 isoform X2 [Physella acuta]|uniref:uncharacterized protein LOC131943094 isoform X2 n=1 Tax=Physella acuta TaxID=109671 RepID=UPI0027DE38BD|nr:uncharacterized protein LOC131943094 isoform X2 [Physella acuta]
MSATKLTKSALKIPSQTPLAFPPTPIPPAIVLSGLGESQLFDAISEGKTEVVKAIMTYLDKPEALLKLKDLHGWTPLHFAVRGKHVKVVYAGADAHPKNKEDKTPLDLCDEETPYRQILEVNDHALEDGPIDLCSSFIGRKQLNQIGPDGLLLFVTSALWSERMQFILSIRIRPYRADPPIPLQQDEQYFSDVWHYRMLCWLHPRETRVKAYFLKVTSKARYIEQVPVRLSKYKQFGSFPNPPADWDATRAEREKAVVDELMKKYMKEPEDEGTKDKDEEKEQGEASEKEQGEAGEKEQGEAGEKEQGEAGEKEQGEAGEKEQGEAGEKEQGEAGEKEQGEAGEKEQGEAGEKEQGEAGEKEQGEAGEKEQGEAGEKEQGEAGEKEQGEAGEKEQGEAGENEDVPEEDQPEAIRPGTLMERDSSAGCTYGISRGLGYLALTVAVCFCLLHTTSAQWEKMPAELPSIGEVVVQIQEILQQNGTDFCFWLHKIIWLSTMTKIVAAEFKLDSRNCLSLLLDSALATFVKV